MSDSFDDFSNLWKESKAAHQSEIKRESVEELIKLSRAKKKSTTMSHISAIAVMSVTAIVIAYFLGYKYPYHTTLGRFAVGLMVGVLVLRVAIEIVSVFRSSQIHVHDTTADSLNKSLRFLKFRKRVNGPVTYSAIFIYLIGFNLLLPELSLYLSTKALILLDGSAFIIVGIITYVAAKGINREMIVWDKLVEMQKRIRR